MTTWQRIGISGILTGVVGLAIVLPGCGGGGPGNTTGPSPNTEVKIVPPKDASGKEIRIEDEKPSPPPR